MAPQSAAILGVSGSEGRMAAHIIKSGYRGFALILRLNLDRIIALMVLATALLASGWIAHP